MDENLWMAGEEARWEALRRAPAARRERVIRELDFIPLADILAGDDEELKRGAIERLADLATPEAVALLLHYRRDRSGEIRFYVTSALGRIKRRWDEDLEAARDELARARDPERGRLVLARTYVQYAGSGLLDDASAHAFEQEATHHLKLLTAGAGVNGEAGRLLVHLLIRRGLWPEALEVLERMEGDGGAVGRRRSELTAEVFFRMGRYPAVAQELASIRRLEGEDAWRAAADFWNG